jgi:hypothetical protein
MASSRRLISATKISRTVRENTWEDGVRRGRGRTDEDKESSFFMLPKSIDVCTTIDVRHAHARKIYSFVTGGVSGRPARQRRRLDSTSGNNKNGGRFIDAYESANTAQTSLAWDGDTEWATKGKIMDWPARRHRESRSCHVHGQSCSGHSSGPQARRQPARIAAASRQPAIRVYMATTLEHSTRKIKTPHIFVGTQNKPCTVLAVYRYRHSPAPPNFVDPTIFLTASAGITTTRVYAPTPLKIARASQR